MSITANSIGRLDEQISMKMKRGGVELAEITNIKDPDKLNRVKFKLITSDPEVQESDWCFVMTPFGGAGNGIFFFPNVGDLVVVAYVGGDPHHAMVIGSFWTGEKAPPYTVADEKNESYSIRTPLKSELLFTDVKEKEKIILKTPTESQLQIDDENKALNLGDKDGKNVLKIAWGDKGEIELTAEKKITLAAGDTKITMTSEGEVTIKSAKEITLDSAKVTLKTSDTFAASGTNCEVKANSALTLQATGQAVLKGATVAIN